MVGSVSVLVKPELSGNGVMVSMVSMEGFVGFVGFVVVR